MRTTRSIACQKTDAEGFTRIDLLAVMLTAGILCALLLPALAGTKPDSRAFQCLENQRQLVRAWLMYSSDFNDVICLTGGLPYTAVTTTDNQINNGNWVHGRMDLAGAYSTNTALVKAGSLFPYAKSVEIYKCPADTKMQSTGSGVTMNTIRSVSMNGWMNPISSPPNYSGHVFRKQSDIKSASTNFVVIDESPGSINDGWFDCDPYGYPTTWVDLPASYHNRAGGISFADGHAEMKKWTDSMVILYSVPGGPTGNFVPQGTPPGDLKWLQLRSTY